MGNKILAIKADIIKIMIYYVATYSYESWTIRSLNKEKSIFFELMFLNKIVEMFLDQRRKQFITASIETMLLVQNTNTETEVQTFWTYNLKAQIIGEDLMLEKIKQNEVDKRKDGQVLA